MTPNELAKRTKEAQDDFLYDLKGIEDAQNKGGSAELIERRIDRAAKSAAIYTALAMILKTT